MRGKNTPAAYSVPDPSADHHALPHAPAAAFPVQADRVEHDHGVPVDADLNSCCNSGYSQNHGNPPLRDPGAKTEHDLDATDEGGGSDCCSGDNGDRSCSDCSDCNDCSCSADGSGSGLLPRQVSALAGHRDRQRQRDLLDYGHCGAELVCHCWGGLWYRIQPWSEQRLRLRLW